MEAEEQRKVLADAAERGLTLVEFLKEFQKSDVSGEVYGEMYGRTPVPKSPIPSECPVVAVIMDGIVELAKFVGGDTPQYWLSHWQGSAMLAASTDEEQVSRMNTVVRWFRSKILVQVDTSQIPAADLSSACRGVFLAITDSDDNTSVPRAVFAACLALANANRSAIARTGKPGGYDSFGHAALHQTAQLSYDLFTTQGDSVNADVQTPDDVADLERQLKFAEQKLGFGTRDDGIFNKS